MIPRIDTKCNTKNRSLVIFYAKQDLDEVQRRQNFNIAFTTIYRGKIAQFVSELTVYISPHQCDIFDDLDIHRSLRTNSMTHKILFWYAKRISTPALRYQWRMNYTLDQNVVLSDPHA